MVSMRPWLTRVGILTNNSFLRAPATRASTCRCLVTSRATVGHPWSSDEVAKAREVESVLLLPCDLYDGEVKNALTELKTTQQLDPVLGACFIEWSKEPSVSEPAPSQLFAATLTRKGDGRSQPNQDQAFVLKYMVHHASGTEPVIVSGVLDGHGTSGDTVAERCRQEFLKRLPPLLSELDEVVVAAALAADAQEDKQNEQNLVSTAISRLLEEIDQNLPTPAAIDGGATASFVLNYRGNLYFINTGDSTSFLVAAIVDEITGMVRWTDVQFATKAHHPTGAERSRLNAAGIRVCAENRVWVDTVDEPYSLGLSRALGDREAVGLIATPTVDVKSIDRLVELSIYKSMKHLYPDVSTESMTEVQITENNVRLFVVSATDGLLDKISQESVASRFVTDICGRKMHVLSAMEALLRDASGRWFDSHMFYRDDMAMAVVRIV